MMKNSSLLKWTTNKNNKNSKNGSQNWLHSAESLQSGHIVYLVKFLGTTEVNQAKGIDVVKEAIRKLRFNQQLKKSEGSKTPKVELTISANGVAIQQPKSKKVMFQYPLHQISYCADDKAEKRFFSFIAKESDRESHSCYVFISDKLAEEITLTIGQAFDLAYRRFLETSSREIELRRQVAALQHQLMTSQSENSTLKDRLTQVAALKNRQDLDTYMQQDGINDLLFVNGDQSTEVPIIHSPPPPTIDLPPVPPRNIMQTQLIEDLFSSPEELGPSDEDNDDFDPRAEEFKMTNSGGGGSQGNESPDPCFASDEDDFDPRAHEKIFGNQTLNGVSPIPQLVPPPRPSRPQDKIILQAEDPFSFPPNSTPPPANDILAQFNEMKVGFSRGLSFGTTDSDFTLDSLDPLKN